MGYSICDNKGKVKTMDNGQAEKTIEAYGAMLYKIALVRLKNTDDAEDVVQEVFCQYIKSDKTFDSDEHEKAWLIKVTLNACKRFYRLAWNRHKGEISEEDFLKIEADSGHPETECLQKETERKILQAVLELPLKYRDVIHLFYYEEMSVKEIAEVLHRQESTVTSQLTRARGILKKNLGEEYQFEEF